MQVEEALETNFQEMNHQPTRSEEELSVGTGYGDLDDRSDSSQVSLQADSGFSSPASELGSESSSSSCDMEERREDAVAICAPKYSMTAVRGRRRACASLAGATIVDEEAKIVWPHRFA